MTRIRRAAPWFILGIILLLASCCASGITGFSRGVRGPTVTGPSGDGGIWTWGDHDQGTDGGSWNNDDDTGGGWDWGGGSDSGSWDGGDWDSGGSDSGSWDWGGGSDSGSWDWGGGGDSGSWDSGGSDSGSW